MGKRLGRRSLTSRPASRPRWGTGGLGEHPVRAALQGQAPRERERDAAVAARGEGPQDRDARGPGPGTECNEGNGKRAEVGDAARLWKRPQVSKSDAFQFLPGLKAWLISTWSPLVWRVGRSTRVLAEFGERKTEATRQRQRQTDRAREKKRVAIFFVSFSFLIWS